MKLTCSHCPEALPAVVLWGLISLAMRAELATWRAADTELMADRQTGRVGALRHRANNASWASSAFALFQVKGSDRLRTELNALATADGIHLSFRIVNDDAQPQWVTPIFGRVDFIHFFDWASTPEHGRVGDYAPWDHLGGLAECWNQLKALRDGGVPSGLYLEGYLASPESQIAERSGQDWAMTDAKGTRVDAWGGGYYTMCPHVQGWQDYLADTCRRLAEQTGTSGLYIDQFGFLTQYRCSNPAHAPFHAMGAHMLAGEYAMLRKIRAAVGSRTVLYTEEIPTDVMTQFTDGAYTAAVSMSLKRGIFAK